MKTPPPRIKKRNVRAKNISECVCDTSWWRVTRGVRVSSARYLKLPKEKQIHLFPYPRTYHPMQKGRRRLQVRWLSGARVLYVEPRAQSHTLELASTTDTDLQNTGTFTTGVTGPDNDQDQTTTTLFGHSLVLKFSGPSNDHLGLGGVFPLC